MLLWFLVLRIAFYEIFPNLQCSSAVGVFCIQITDMVGGGGGSQKVYLAHRAQLLLSAQQKDLTFTKICWPFSFSIAQYFCTVFLNCV